MRDQDPFYDQVFRDPGEGLLLGLGRLTSDKDAFDEKSPSWMSGGPFDHGAPSDRDRKKFLLDLTRGYEGELQQLNQALGQGWKLERITLSQPNGEQAAPAQAQQVVMTLRPDSPRSLFDFGE